LNALLFGSPLFAVVLAAIIFNVSIAKEDQTPNVSTIKG